MWRGGERALGVRLGISEMGGKEVVGFVIVEVCVFCWFLICILWVRRFFINGLDEMDKYSIFWI